MPTPRLVRVLVVAGLVAVPALNREGASLSAQPPPALPSRFDAYVKAHVGLSADERARLLAGEPVTALLQADPAREVAIFGAIWVDAPMTAYLDAVRDIESFEKGRSFLVTKRIGDPPRLEDFDRLTLSPADLAGLKTCKVGDCELKLGEPALTRIRNEIDWSAPTATADAERAIRRLALEYVVGYLEGGNSRLAVYRDSERPTFVASEFAALIDRMPEMTGYLPEFRTYLLDYPAVRLPNADSFLYWQHVKFGLKPTVRINHVTVADRRTHAVVISKMLYASHYFWTAIEVRVLMPDATRGEGFWLASVNRSRSDGLGGFVGGLIRGKVRAEVEKGMQAALAATKLRLER